MKGRADGSVHELDGVLMEEWLRVIVGGSVLVTEEMSGW